PLWLVVLARKLFLGAATTDGPPIYGDAFAATVRLSRILSATFGVVTIALTFTWARRFGGAVPWVAAALVAGFPALVQTSHFGTVESALTALLVLGLVAAERLAERPSPARAAAAGLVFGLALSVKAPAILLGLPLLHAARRRAEKDSSSAPYLRVLIGSVVTAAVVIALNPMLLSGADAGARTGEHTTLAGNLRRAYSGDFHDWTLPYAKDVPGWTELTRVLPYAIGVLPEIAALVGVVLLLRRRRPADVRLLLLLIPFALLLLPARVKTVRFLVPALPALAVAAAVALAALTARRAGLGRAVTTGVVALAVLHGIAFSSIYTRPDPRVAAARWLDEHVAPRELVLLEDPAGYGPPVGSPSPELVRPMLRVEFLWRGFYTQYETLDAAGRRAHLERLLKRADWLTLSEGHRREFTTSPELRPVESEFYRELDAGRLPFERVAVFETYPRLGPIVLKDDGAEALMRGFDHPRVEIWKRSRAAGDLGDAELSEFGP
ncbi:MAG: glycosyltransferase family 39 protein, partial [Gemmatimonadetes bacterium]|nr:glycosyltransferase family 39 protein [Gemmatimonadota bacterium]